MLKSFFKMFTRDLRQGDGKLADALANDPEPSFWTTWVGGLVVPIPLAVYAITCMATRTALLPGHHGDGLDLAGTPALALGGAWLCAALFLHFHYFWTAKEPLFLFADAGKILSSIGFIACFGTTCWLIAMRG